MSDEFTPEAITAQLKELGITESGEVKNGAQHKAEKSEPSEKIQETNEEETNEEVVLEAKEESNDSDVEADARAMGWSPDGVKSAAEFLRAAPLYEEIKARGKKEKELLETINELKAHMDKQQKLAYEQALADLREERDEAISLGDVEQVNQLDYKIKEQEKTHKAVDESPEALAFVSKHSDWINDPSYEAQKMREFTAKRDQELLAYNLSPTEHLKILENDLKGEFPNKFKNKENIPYQSVESGANKVSKTANKLKYGFSDLSPEQKKCARHFEKRGIMKTEDYIKSLVNLGELS